MKKIAEKKNIVAEAPKKRGRPRKNPIIETSVEAPAPKKRGRPRKNPVIEVEEVKKPKIRKQMAKKIAEKKMTKKDKKAIASDPQKLTMKSADKLFDQVKKSISAAKKATKLIAKFYGDALKTGDEQYFARVQKRFNRLGYAYSPVGQLSLLSNAKVKLPKVKKAKAKNEIKSEEQQPQLSTKRKYVRKVNAQKIEEQPKENTVAEEPIEKKPVEAAPVEAAPEIVATVIETKTEEQPQISNEEQLPVDKELPTDEELAAIDNELSELDEDEEEDEDCDPYDSSDLRTRRESDDEIFGDMRENGDFEE